MNRADMKVYVRPFFEPEFEGRDMIEVPRNFILSSTDSSPDRNPNTRLTADFSSTRSAATVSPISMIANWVPPAPKVGPRESGRYRSANVSLCDEAILSSSRTCSCSEPA